MPGFRGDEICTPVFSSKQPFPDELFPLIIMSLPTMAPDIEPDTALLIPRGDDTTVAAPSNGESHAVTGTFALGEI